MAIISAIGRKHWKVRALFAGMYVFLILGAATMVYPFLLMISGSTKSAMDIKFFDAIPRFLYDQDWMYAKHLEGLFNERVLDLDMVYDADEVAFERMPKPTEPRVKLAAELETFLSETDLPFYAYAPGYLSTPISRTMPSALRGFKQFLAARFGENIEDVNRALGTEYVGWNSVYALPPSCLLRRDMPVLDSFTQALTEYCSQIPFGMRYYHSPEGFFKKQYLKTQYGMDIARYNELHGTSYPDYSAVHLAREYPGFGTERERRDWEDFVRNTLALQWIRIKPEAKEEFLKFLLAKHQNITNINKHYGTAFASVDDIPLYRDLPASGMALTDWESFITGWKDPESGRMIQVPVRFLYVVSVEFMFQDWLLDRYDGSLNSLNAALGTTIADVSDLLLPQKDLHQVYFLQHIGNLRWEFVARNYRTVAEYMLFHGRGIVNTVIYCALAILSALLVNPLAAYAMSRYRMPSSYKILLFLMCTMAFPPMVTSIPNFLMLRKLGLLNTFAALILPGMANGYSIFLLKGFFDAQPQELYESAQLDGASEWVLFWNITMSLSKPILAVIALQAFTMAYSNFMFAFVTCQDEKMWTLMVWLYQLQQRSGQAVMYASLIIAAIPTFLIFLFCQNIIMRGIVVPSEK